MSNQLMSSTSGLLYRLSQAVFLPEPKIFSQEKTVPKVLCSIHSSRIFLFRAICLLLQVGESVPNAVLLGYACSSVAVILLLHPSDPEA